MCDPERFVPDVLLFVASDPFAQLRDSLIDELYRLRFVSAEIACGLFLEHCFGAFEHPNGFAHLRMALAAQRLLAGAGRGTLHRRFLRRSLRNNDTGAREHRGE